MVRCWSILLLVIAIGPCVWAETFTASGDVPVFSSAESELDPVAYLHSGDSFRLLKKINGFAQIRYQGHKTGFILESNLPADRQSHYALGFFAMGGGLHQAGRSFTTTDQVDYETSGYSGTQSGFGLFFDDPYSEHIRLRIYLSEESVHFKGTAIKVGIPGAPTQSVDLQETWVTGGGTVQYYLAQGLWVGGGIAISRGLSLKLSLNGIESPTLSEDLPNLFELYGGLGYDLVLFRSLLVTPEFRFGDSVTSRPTILIYQAFLGLGWLF